jgi:hypothetical protein
MNLCLWSWEVKKLMDLIDSQVGLPQACFVGLLGMKAGGVQPW